ncbi:lytic murein transglycosylase [Mesorhizobium sp. M7A.F.Ca.US.001.01.1.1]|nr:lytic murein transglycosylase [Mesorhizobium sp. M7A.F.Ca.US.001.01.1.1]
MAGQRPLCPAGHLPLQGEIECTSGFANRQCWKKGETTKLPISPLEGEMPGRAEGT